MSTPTKKKETVYVGLDANTHKRLLRLIELRNKDRKYHPAKVEDHLEEIIWEAERHEKARENRKTNARRLRLNFRKWYVSTQAYERLQAIKARIAAEANPQEWGSLNRIDQNTKALTLLLDDFEQADERRHVPIGAHVGGRPDTCPTCMGQVGEVYRDGKPMLDLDGHIRICTTTGTEQFMKAARELATWVPEYGLAMESMDKKIKKAYKANGADEGEFPPFFSEVCTYEVFGKDTARTLRAMLREVFTSGGIPPERTHEFL